MKTEPIPGLNPAGNIALINLDMMFQLREIDFSEWKFSDDPALDALLSTPAGSKNTYTSKIKGQGINAVRAA